jgi:hypothetical protein
LLLLAILRKRCASALVGFCPALFFMDANFFG